MNTLFDFQDDNIEVRGYIDKREILKYITEEEIYESVLNFKPKEFDYICSPLRQDNHPGAFFQRGLYSNKLLFVDWADPFNTHYDCFSFIQRYHNLPNFYATLKFIKENLINKNGRENTRAINKDLQSGIKRENDKKVEIIIEARAFNKTDKYFWSKYGISSKNLKDDKVFAVNQILIKNTRRGDRLIPLYTKCFAYTDFPDNRKKLYFPYNKGRKRFISTCTKNDIITKHLIKVPQLMITKSYKDYRVLRNLGANVIWFQNEGAFPDNLEDIINDYEDIIIFFDNDFTGLAASEKLVNIIGVRARGIHLPILLLEEGIKDASDMYLKKGVDELKLFLTRSKVNLYETIRHNSQ